MESDRVQIPVTGREALETVQLVRALQESAAFNRRAIKAHRRALQSCMDALAKFQSTEGVAGGQHGPDTRERTCA